MTPNYCKRQPGPGGHSHLLLKQCMRGRQRALSVRHDVPRRNGWYITLAAAACKGYYEVASHMPSPLLYPLNGQHEAFHPPLRLATLHHPRTQSSLYKTARSLL